MKIFLDKFETVTVKTEEAVPTPKHYCATCARLNNDLVCDCFQRRVEPNHNRCFNHSSYVSPSIKAVFKPIPKDEMDKIVEQNEAAA
jgi:hypothetical protein